MLVVTSALLVVHLSPVQTIQSTQRTTLVNFFGGKRLIDRSSLGLEEFFRLLSSDGLHPTSDGLHASRLN